MLVGYMRVSSDSDRQTTDLQRDALLSAGVDSRHLTNLAAGDTSVGSTPGWRVEIQLRIPLNEPPTPPDRGMSSKDCLRSLGIENVYIVGQAEAEPLMFKTETEPLPRWRACRSLR